jgi:hypothetical protein
VRRSSRSVSRSSSRVSILGLTCSIGQRMQASLNYFGAVGRWFDTCASRQRSVLLNVQSRAPVILA